MRAIQVNPNSPNNFYGPGSRTKAKAHARKNGVGAHMRPDGGLTLYYLDGEKLRQKSWKRFTLSEPVKPWNEL